ncbi:EPIDERMAL PATTERNING FACTOR-like protein 2 [Diospyros lotus]|uniref:EPIDERMAL PATTERNING FACTOR-like protein 2 n=1 Tax=Diospyros lotus TaxID=55363 RepID=UPI002253C35B|nr:EPIDERMAL PATTERNING FACTOR-like protein 2 [Diospyros lotus]
MGSCRNFMRGRHKLHHLSFPFLFLLISSWTQFPSIAEGRAFLRSADRSKEEKIGSKPPQCEKRCSSCGHCQAIQVPINPQTRTGNRRNSSDSLSTHYARADDSSNYKPLSWMCKCGNSFFNP